MNAITRPTTHADAAATALRQALAASHAGLRDAVAAYRTATSGLAPDADLLDVLRAAGNIALAAEAIAAASKEAETAARSALAQAMTEVGCPAFRLASHTVHLSHKPAYVAIEDASVIPADLMRIPPPQPDKVAIGKLLRAGKEVPGCRFAGNREPLCIFKGIYT
jgi:Siphovirus Gp157